MLWLGIGLVLATPVLAAEYPYRVRIRGIDDRNLLNDLRSVSNMIELRKHPPASLRQLERRAHNDRDRFLRVLRAYGYYDASIDIRIREDRSPVRVRFGIDTGPRYTLRDLLVEWDEPLPATLHWQIEDMLRAERGAPAVAQQVVRLEERLVQRLQQNGYAFAAPRQRSVWVSHAGQAMDVTFELTRGPSVDFGETTIEGLTTVRARFVENKIPWSAGDPFNLSQLRLAQRRLMASDLFSSARVIRADEPDEENRVSVQLELSERKHRSLTLGASYMSDEGAGGRMGWEHRNFFGAGERVTLAYAQSEIGYGASARFIKPDVWRPDQQLTWDIRTDYEEPDAFRSRSARTLVSLERPLRPQLMGTAGIGFKYASVREDVRDERFGLIYLPLRVAWDGSDSVLDPRDGMRVSLSTAPYRDVIDTEITFLKSRLATTVYFPLIRRPVIDGALRVVIGQIAGVGRDAVPADERLYAGGGGSVRGYAFQSVGPLDGKRPLGGRSEILTSAELRWRINEEFGLVAFIDGGTVPAAPFPDDTDDTLWGTGAGFRYFTPVGPLRFDLAFPLNRRSGIDDNYQFYISLGQAF